MAGSRIEAGGSVMTGWTVVSGTVGWVSAGSVGAAVLVGARTGLAGVLGATGIVVDVAGALEELRAVGIHTGVELGAFGVTVCESVFGVAAFSLGLVMLVGASAGIEGIGRLISAVSNDTDPIKPSAIEARPPALALTIGNGWVMVNI
jgi:hypothetical protein